jgi:hypothetical protein
MVAILLPGNEDAHGTGQLPSWLPLPVYATFLSVVSELLAFAAVGLIAGWGEVLPRWIPGLGGRRVPPLAAALPAALAAVVLTAVWTFTAVTMLSGHTLQGRPVPPDHPLKALHGWELGAFLLSYAPLLLWGPLLGALCFAYWRRRRSSASRPPALAAARAG